MSIFTEIHELRTFMSLADYKECMYRLSSAIERGWIEEIPVAIKRPVLWNNERWFREKETGEVYLLTEPEPPATGSWRPVEPEELFPSTPIASTGHTVN